MTVNLEGVEEARVREVVEGVLDRALQEAKKNEPDSDFTHQLADLADQLCAGGEFDLNETHRGQTSFRVGFIAYSLDALATIRPFGPFLHAELDITPHLYLQSAEAHLKAAIEAQVVQTREGLRRWRDGRPPLPEKRDAALTISATAGVAAPMGGRGRKR